MGKIELMIAVVVVEAVWRTLGQREEEWLLLLAAAVVPPWSLWCWTLKPFMHSLCSECLCFPLLCVGVAETEFKDTIASRVQLVALSLCVALEQNYFRRASHTKDQQTFQPGNHQRTNTANHAQRDMRSL